MPLKNFQRRDILPGRTKGEVYMKDALEFFVSSGNIRLDAQLKFSAVIDRMCSVFRRTILLDRSRHENDAEHSWHIAVMALLLEEYAVEKVDVLHAVEMLLVHDLVEIYAGDTFAYDTAGNASKEAREKEAANRLFSQLPPEQGEYLRGLWEEFDRGTGADARYANCLDRVQPFLHNVLTEGYTWQNSEPQPDADMVRLRMAVLKDFMPELHKWVEKAIQKAVENQHLKER